MSDDKNFLQSIKLEISRSFKLDSYERIAFHRILSYSRSEAGRDILIREIEKSDDIRLSAISALAEFNDPVVNDVFLDAFNRDLSDDELIIILDFFERTGTDKEVQPLMQLYDKKKNDLSAIYLVNRIFNVLKKIGAENTSFHQFLIGIINDSGTDQLVLESAVSAVSVLKNTGIYEDLLKRNNDNLSYYVFISIYNLIMSMKKIFEVEDEEYTPGAVFVEKEMNEEEELILHIKVLLGRMTARFEDYSIRTKNAYVNAMLSCNHREAAIFAMKALESKNNELIRNTFFSIHRNIIKLRFPEKLLRSLINFNAEDEENNRLIVQIFVKYFTERNTSRSDILFRDKVLGNITTTLEGFFETYRREFMIADVAEKSLPDNFRKIRSSILNKLNPEQKRKLVTDIVSQERDLPRKILSYLSDWIKYIDGEDLEAFSLLLDLILDEDRVSRENTSARIDSINFDKRYLRSKIVRLCDIINLLNIEGAAKSLVYIYNYLKKYPDREIFQAAVNALCRINYSYMLSEVEIMLNTGSIEEQVLAVSLLPLFTEKRLINILVEYLKNNYASSGEIMYGVISILAYQEIKSNINAIAVFKQVIEKNQDVRIRQIAINGVGNCCITEDIEYLNDLFAKVKEQPLKEAVVKGICSIIAYRGDYNKQQVMRFVQEYLKDPDIRVRIFSCMILIRLGNKDAFRSIREMLVIKNKSIQREILSILRDIRTPDFYFFLVSLLKEEFGISEDIISLFRKLPVEELKEIENFIINIFRKYEHPMISTGVVTKDSNKLQNSEKKWITVIFFQITNFDALISGKNFYELIEFYLKVDSIILKPLMDNSGVISYKDDSSVTAWFNDAMNSIRAINEINYRLSVINNSTVYQKNIIARLLIISGFFLLNGDEIFDYTKENLNININMPLSNRIVLDYETAKGIEKSFYSVPLPELLYSGELSDRVHYEFISHVNFMSIAMGMLEKKEEELEKKKQLQAEIKAKIKNLALENRSTTSIAIAGELENIGVRLKEQLEEIERYINRRTADRELSKNVHQMILNVYNLYRVEISKLIIK